MKRITIDCGPLSGVDPESLRHAFFVMRLGGIAADAELSVETIDVSVMCLECNTRTTVLANRLVCATCGGFRTRLLAGDELRLRRVEMQVPETEAE